ncbi:putative sterol-4-alpha-carboxylate 3-dehydrogenase, decarboxylating [Hyaloscypha bicolor E]|uniref:Putative sterol-4-alpha-carboxylate 3-dehydrogenase, decarboxylating n=1 Tax=Hyaloscypha bicolor E TaxID=1095630 RepID=A0A2J6SKW3_9HELO|nr:putative sterol-4-alpha-carboxylate 3-dehydrogenase, decarboxylating [Hyaloscypha bicolor E]PMD51360.1 putative sterol-4-alpha-carboxylate 3-dehydrogenase, decarboxylating [Hyaloscypha bicolor E]
MSSVTSLETHDSTGPHLGTVLVVGGCGFLGHHVVKFLLDEPSCTSVAVMSRRPTTKHFPGQVRLVLEQVKPHVIINTASPHAYIDHSLVPQTFRVNIEGNQNLLEVAAEVGTVKAYVYTSSGPIIAGTGGAYDHADENYPTLAVPVIRKGDPYHVAKAIGDKLVLEANGKNGIRTCTVRPTALYGEGDFQNVVPTMQALEDGNHKIWMGYNDIFMDVVYVGHVARLELLAAKALLAGITDPTAPKVDGEAFNITDDQPAYPLNFFRKYWAIAGDKTPLSSVWLIPPPVVMFLANSAEFITWAMSWGKKRPKLLIKERMEFILYTRTYSIKKARERLGFKPWEKQPKEDFSSEELRRIIDGFATVFEQHNHDEIQTILNLHDKIDSKTLKTIATKFFKESEKQSDIFK